MDSPRFNSGFSTIIEDEKINQQKVKQCTRVVFLCVLNIQIYLGLLPHSNLG